MERREGKRGLAGTGVQGLKRRILVPLVTYPEANAEAIAVSAVRIAGTLDASIHALAINVEIAAAPHALSRFLLNVPEMAREAEAASLKRGQLLLEAITVKAGAAGIAATTNAISAPPALLAETAALHARYYDLTLLGWEQDSVTSRTVAEAVVFSAGRPALLVPEAASIADFDHVAIAWDGSRVAARAVADAAQFLSRAASVSVLTALDEKPLKRTVADRLADGFVRSGIEAKAVPVECKGRPIGDVLQTEAIERGASLLVMGGYGHSRLRDFVLGGATAGVLDALRLPVLLSH